MNIQKRIKFIIVHIRKTGILTTFSYFWQRITKPKNHLIALKLSGLPYKVFLRNKTFDIHIYYQIFIKEDLDFNYGKDISTILDCGANIGLSSLYYYRKYKDARIIAIEPENRNFELLIKNTSHYKIITPIKIAVFNEDCDLTLVDIGAGEASYRIMNATDKGNVLQTIPCRSINSLMKELHLSKIDILKMDIEGSEKECLFSPNIQWLKKTKYFLLEIHENIHPGLTKAIYDIIPDTSKFFFNGEYTLIENLNN